MKRIIPISCLCLALLVAGCGGDASQGIDLEALQAILAAAATATAQAAPGGAVAAGTPIAPSPTVAATPVPAVPAARAEGSAYDARFLVDLSVPDGTVLPPGTAFVKGWRLENCGGTTWVWGDLFLTHIGGDALSPEPRFLVHETAPGEMADVKVAMAAPAEPGEYRSVWQAVTAEGTRFGPPVHASIVVSEDAPPPAPCIPQAGFVADVTMPDDTRVDPGQRFVKTWRLRNVGECAWPEGTLLRHVNGERLAPVTATILGPVLSGDTVDVSLPMTSPQKAGAYTSYWQVCDAGGDCHGAPLYARIVVGKSVFGPVVK